jgi:hypothetical protein
MDDGFWIVKQGKAIVDFEFYMMNWLNHEKQCHSEEKL